jgi:prepilin-type N-terminal cleavage/methylation domain-containing protein
MCQISLMILTLRTGNCDVDHICPGAEGASCYLWCDGPRCLFPAAVNWGSGLLHDHATSDLCAMIQRRRGYTIFELLLVVTIIGALAAMAIPKMKEPMVREQVRSARRTMVTHLAMARGAAASRGCRGVVHVVSGANARAWVTTCRVAGAGMDTVGAVHQLSNRYNVSVQSSIDSVQFSPNGIAIGAGWSTLVFARAGFSDTLTVSPLGKASW